MSRSYLALVVGLVVLPACPLLDVEADVQDACVTYPGLQVAALPSVNATIEKSFTVGNLDSFKELASQGFDLSFVHGEAHATSGITDFTFVRKATMAVASGDPSSTLPTLDVFNCEACAPTGDTLEIGAATQADAAPYITTGSIIVTIDLTGTPPAVDWTMDVDVCMTGSGSYELNE
jgi:hypothetical protein